MLCPYRSESTAQFATRELAGRKERKNRAAAAEFPSEVNPALTVKQWAPYGEVCIGGLGCEAYNFVEWLVFVVAWVLEGGLSAVLRRAREAGLCATFRRREGECPEVCRIVQMRFSGATRI